MTIQNLASAVSADQESALNNFLNAGIPDATSYQQENDIDIFYSDATKKYVVCFPFPVTQLLLDYVNENYFVATRDCVNSILVEIESLKSESEVIETLKEDFDDIVRFTKKYKAYEEAKEKTQEALLLYISTPQYLKYLEAVKAEEKARLRIV